MSVAQTYNDITAIVTRTDNKEVIVLKEIVDNLINKIGKGFVFIANEKDGNVNFICRSSCDINAGLIVKRASQMSDGNGGGSPTFAQGGGKTVEHLNEIFEVIKQDLKDCK